MVFLTFFLGKLTPVPAEIRARGLEAELAFQRALQQNEKVNVCRGRVMIVGQERAGKTSLKKSLLGMPFNKEEESTVGIEVDPSKFEVNVDQVINWGPIKDEKLKSDFRKQMAKLIAKEMTKNEADQSVTDSEEVPMNYWWKITAHLLFLFVAVVVMMIYKFP